MLLGLSLLDGPEDILGGADGEELPDGDGLFWTEGKLEREGGNDFDGDEVLVGMALGDTGAIV